eukprot:37812_1
MSNGIIKVGDTVLLSKNRLGIVRYYGKTQFASGYWFGIELIDTSLTRHNGMILNKQYFKCPPNKGLFARHERIKKVMKRSKKRTYSLKLNLQKKRTKRRIPKYKLDKENERFKSLASMASKNQNEPIMDRHHKRFDIIPIERIPNELLSDNESIELSSEDAIVIERNLINYGDEECQDIAMDNFIRDLNDIEYSFSVANDPLPLDQHHQNNDIDRVLHLDIDDYQIQDQMFPIEGDGDPQTCSEKEKQTYDGYTYYLMIRYGLWPCLVYGGINALIVCALYLIFNANEMQSHWKMDVDLSVHVWLDSVVHISSLFGIDLWITTVVETISIWFFVTLSVQKDVIQGHVARIDSRLNDVCCNCFLSNHDISLCQRWLRNMICAFVWMVGAIIVFYMPTMMVLHVWMNEEHVMKFGYIQMMIFKASYGGVIALIVSPLTACFTLL